MVSTEFVGLGSPIVSSPMDAKNLPQSAKTATPLLPTRRKSSRIHKRTEKMVEYERELRSEKKVDDVDKVDEEEDDAFYSDDDDDWGEKTTGVLVGAENC